MSDRSFVSVSVDRATHLANQAIASIDAVRSQRRASLKAAYIFKREWWRRFIPWLPPLSDARADSIVDEMCSITGFPEHPCLYYAWGTRSRCETVLLLCGLSSDGLVHLDVNLAEAIEASK